jgi:hypothetical protein
VSRLRRNNSKRSGPAKFRIGQNGHYGNTTFFLNVAAVIALGKPDFLEIYRDPLRVGSILVKPVLRRPVDIVRLNVLCGPGQARFTSKLVAEIFGSKKTVLDTSWDSELGGFWLEDHDGMDE